MAEALGALLEASLDPRRNKEGMCCYSNWEDDAEPI